MPMPAGRRFISLIMLATLVATEASGVCAAWCLSHEVAPAAMSHGGHDMGATACHANGAVRAPHQHAGLLPQMLPSRSLAALAGLPIAPHRFAAASGTPPRPSFHPEPPPPRAA